MTPVNPAPVYDYTNEAQFRAQVLQEDLRNVKTTSPISSLVFIDAADGKPYRVTLDGGMFVFDEVMP